MNNRVRPLKGRLGDALERWCISEGTKVMFLLLLWLLFSAVVLSRPRPTATVPAAIPIPLHTSSLPQSRSSHIDHFHLLFLHFNILPKVHVKQQSKAMSNSKPYVSSSGTVGAQPLTHKISIKLSDFATLAYLFFETLVSVSQDKWQIHIFYLSCVHIMIGRKRIKR